MCTCAIFHQINFLHWHKVLLQFKRFLGCHDNLSKEELTALLAECRYRYRMGLRLGSKLLDTVNQYSDFYVILATHIKIDLYNLTGELVFGSNIPSNYGHYWASVSEPHTCDFNATFSLYVVYLYIYIYATVTVLLKLRSIYFDISLRILYVTRVHCPDAHAERPAPSIVKATAHRGRAWPRVTTPSLRRGDARLGRAVNLRVACALAV